MNIFLFFILDRLRTHDGESEGGKSRGRERARSFSWKLAREEREREDSHWGGLGRKGEREFLYYLNLRNDKNALGIFLLKKQNAVLSYFKVQDRDVPFRKCFQNIFYFSNEYTLDPFSKILIIFLIS